MSCLDIHHVACVFRIAALEGELTHIRELVVLLGKAMGRLPGGQQLPGHGDPVWLQLGPLGGVSFALDTVIQHTRVRMWNRMASVLKRPDCLQLAGARSSAAGLAAAQSLNSPSSSSSYLFLALTDIQQCGCRLLCL
jgi:hypothetical protein